jgi:cytochrome c oxidase assembly protein subunit 11
MTTKSARNRRTVISLLAILFVMGTLVYYAVPLYQAFCQITGFGGTTRQADADTEPMRVHDRVITIRFVAEVNPNLDWEFVPQQATMRVRVGEPHLAHYRARNLGDEPITGVATFNVTPQKAGVHFVKTACFCFNQQTLRPGQSVDMPVSFFVDPGIMEDRNLDDVDEITLSYTFFRAVRQADSGTSSGETQ